VAPQADRNDVNAIMGRDKMKSASRHGFHEDHAEASPPPGPRVADGRSAFETLVRAMLVELGEDPTREGLRQTPARVEASLKWLTRGYHMAVADVIGDALYSERHENLVCVRDIEIYSMCEHHMLPFFGKAHVAYLPNGRLVGLSKIPRVIEVFARRLQVQERLTDQVADALMEVLDPRGVGVVIEAYHLCMMMRGVEKQNSKTVTSALRGALLQDAKTRDEFLRLVYGGRGLE
jgi:GTP cyclohydrolase IA